MNDLNVNTKASTTYHMLYVILFCVVFGATFVLVRKRGESRTHPNFTLDPPIVWLRPGTNLQWSGITTVTLKNDKMGEVEDFHLACDCMSTNLSRGQKLSPSLQIGIFASNPDTSVGNIVAIKLKGYSDPIEIPVKFADSVRKGENL
jgi:hypothetical protein